MQISDAIPNLPAEIVRHGLETLIGILPRPIPDTPENRAAREASAIRAVAALRPRDAFQLMLAVQIVGTDAHAMECLRFAAVRGQPLDIVQRARSQACSLWRVSDASLRDLMRTQDRQDRSAATRPAARPARTPGAQAAAKRSGDPAKPPKLYLVH